MSPTRRVTTKAAFFDAWFNIIPRDGNCEYFYTPWHREDLSAEILKKAADPTTGWTSFYMPVEEVGGKLLPVWPERWPAEALAGRAKEIGGPAFARGFKLLAIDDEDCPLLKYVPQMRRKDVEPGWLQRDGRQGWPRVIAVDLGVGKTSKHSETVILCVAIAPNGQKWIEPERSFRGRVSSPEAARKVVEAWRVSKAELVLVESNAYQASLIDWIREVLPSCADIPIQGRATGAEKWHEQLGVPGMAAEIEAGGWNLPFGPQDHVSNCQCVLCELYRQAAEWPQADHDDCVMAWWIASKAAKRVGAALHSAKASWQTDGAFDEEPRSWSDPDPFGDGDPFG
jgi:hypothetical protein